ncbi:hypothetical protein CANCADRAFT_1764 [Tortispora caseinolytica NRRL Y-17796]|uniref:Uncharacterized protein n=1 Tax=Tortispora caseinolytica NRRL Y-17796 TaxID=767744 RepID=A0A1E4TE54_9ASCO|nr:hypothetical protein CANCADRAFT_1764 [Tortispora caseinolytica NRRL Y-17796]
MSSGMAHDAKDNPAQVSESETKPDPGSTANATINSGSSALAGIPKTGSKKFKPASVNQIFLAHSQPGSKSPKSASPSPSPAMAHATLSASPSSAMHSGSITGKPLNPTGPIIATGHYRLSPMRHDTLSKPKPAAEESAWKSPKSAAKDLVPDSQQPPVNPVLQSELDTTQSKSKDNTDAASNALPSTAAATTHQQHLTWDSAEDDDDDWDNTIEFADGTKVIVPDISSPVVPKEPSIIEAKATRDPSEPVWNSIPTIPKPKSIFSSESVINAAQPPAKQLHQLAAKQKPYQLKHEYDRDYSYGHRPLYNDADDRLDSAKVYGSTMKDRSQLPGRSISPRGFKDRRNSSANSREERLEARRGREHPSPIKSSLEQVADHYGIPKDMSLAEIAIQQEKKMKEAQKEARRRKEEEWAKEKAHQEEVRKKRLEELEKRLELQQPKQNANTTATETNAVAETSMTSSMSSSQNVANLETVRSIFDHGPKGATSKDSSSWKQALATGATHHEKASKELWGYNTTNKHAERHEMDSGKDVQNRRGPLDHASRHSTSHRGPFERRRFSGSGSTGDRKLVLDRDFRKQTGSKFEESWSRLHKFDGKRPDHDFQPRGDGAHGKQLFSNMQPDASSFIASSGHNDHSRQTTRQNPFLPAQDPSAQSVASRGASRFFPTGMRSDVPEQPTFVSAGSSGNISADSIPTLVSGPQSRATNPSTSSQAYMSGSTAITGEDHQVPRVVLPRMGPASGVAEFGGSSTFRGIPMGHAQGAGQITSVIPGTVDPNAGLFLPAGDQDVLAANQQNYYAVVVGPQAYEGNPASKAVEKSSSKVAELYAGTAIPADTGLRHEGSSNPAALMEMRTEGIDQDSLFGQTDFSYYPVHIITGIKDIDGEKILDERNIVFHVKPLPINFSTVSPIHTPSYYGIATKPEEEAVAGRSYKIYIPGQSAKFVPIEYDKSKYLYPPSKHETRVRKMMSYGPGSGLGYAVSGPTPGGYGSGIAKGSRKPRTAGAKKKLIPKTGYYQ